jgi:hypothetical protein
MGRGKKMTLALLMALAAVAGGERTAAAQSTAAKATPRVVVAETTSIEARLDAVDVKTRRMMVTGPRGKTLTLKVGPDVKDLDQVKPGDQLVVRYFEPLALFVRKGNEPRVAAREPRSRWRPRARGPWPSRWTPSSSRERSRASSMPNRGSRSRGRGQDPDDQGRPERQAVQRGEEGRPDRRAVYRGDRVLGAEAIVSSPSPCGGL